MKMMTTLFAACLALMAAGCGKGTEPAVQETDATTGATLPAETDNNGEKAGDGKTLIVFFSRAGENWQVGTVEKGNTLIPFGTHGGSGVGSYKTMLQTYYPSAKYLESLGINGASVRDAVSKASVEKWVKRLGLTSPAER